MKTFNHDDTATVTSGPHKGVKGWIRKVKGRPDHYKLVGHDEYPTRAGVQHVSNLERCKNPETNEETLDEGMGNTLIKKENASHSSSTTVWPGSRNAQTLQTLYHRSEGALNNHIKSLKKKYGAGNIDVKVNKLNEELDEISKDLASRYFHKSLGDFLDSPQGSARKAKRWAGVNMASAKVNGIKSKKRIKAKVHATEETQIDEISREKKIDKTAKSIGLKMNNEETLDEALSIQQRQKRAQIIKRYKSKMVRARQLAQRKMAPNKNIKKRAYAQARKLIRTKVAGKRGANYANLGPSEKIAIDKVVDTKKALIKKLAMRLVPRVKQAEMTRLHSFMKGSALKSNAPAEGKANGGLHEDIDYHFAEAFPTPFSVKSKRVSPGSDDDMGYSNDKEEMGKKSTSEKKDKNDKDGVDKNELLKNGGKLAPGNKNIIQYTKFEEEVALNSNAFQSLVKKSDSSDIEIEILGEIYNRGCDAWQESYGVSQQQYAFARVNSFINQGKTYFDEDSDLQEGIFQKVKGAIRREKTKDMPLVQNRRDYAHGKAGDAYAKGKNRVGDRYSAWIERSRKKDNIQSSNPTGKYRTKMTDYKEETQIDEISYRDSGYKNMLDASRKADRIADKDRAARAKKSETKEMDKAYDIDEGYKIGDMVNVTNPRATPRHKIVGKNKTHYHIEKPSGEKVHVPKSRIANVNKKAWDLRKDVSQRAAREAFYSKQNESYSPTEHIPQPALKKLVGKGGVYKDIFKAPGDDVHSLVNNVKKERDHIAKNGGYKRAQGHDTAIKAYDSWKKNVNEETQIDEKLAAIGAPSASSRKWNDEVTNRRWKMAADRAKAREKKAKMYEETQIDELSTPTLARYLKQAGKSERKSEKEMYAARSAHNYWKNQKGKDSKEYAKASAKRDDSEYRKRNNRKAGQLKAVDKLIKKPIDESTAYVKPHNENGKQVGWKSSTPHGNVKYWRNTDSGKDAAHKHAGLAVSEDVNNAFNDAFGEEVRSSDTKGVIVRRADGTAYIRKQKVNRKIIKSGNVTDGQPDDNTDSEGST